MPDAELSQRPAHLGEVLLVHPPARATILRLGLAPLLLLAWLSWLGDPLPFLAPCLLVPILLMGAARPPRWRC